MQDLDFIAERLEDIKGELDKVSSTAFLDESIPKLKGILSADTLHIDLYLHSSGTLQEWQRHVHSSKNKYAVSIKREQTGIPQHFGDIHSAIAIIALDKQANSSAPFKNLVAKMAVNYKTVVIMNFSNIISCKKLAKSFYNAPAPSLISLDEISNKNIGELLQATSQKSNALNKLSYLNSIKPIFAGLDDLFNSESKSLLIRKTLYSQVSTIALRAKQALEPEELSNNLSQQIRRARNIAIENLRSKYSEYKKAEGKFGKLKTEKSEYLCDTDFDYQPVDEKNERISVKIKKTFQIDLVQDIKNLLIAEFSNDTLLLNKVIEDVLLSVNAPLTLIGAQRVGVEDIVAPLPEKEKVIDNYAHFSKQFSSDFIKKGTRDYIDPKVIGTIGSVVVGIVLNWHKINVFATILTATPTLIFFFYVIRSIHKKQKEESDSLLEHAQKLISDEVERIYRESSDDWVNYIATWLDEMEKDINFSLNKNIKQLSKTKKKVKSPKVPNIDPVQQRIDNLEHSLETAGRIKKELSTEFKQMLAGARNELTRNVIIVQGKKEIVQQLRKIIVPAAALLAAIFFIVGGIWFSHRKSKVDPGNKSKTETPSTPNTADQNPAEQYFKEGKYAEAKAVSLHFFESNLHNQYIYAASVKELGDTSSRGRSAELFFNCAESGDKDCQYEVGLNDYLHENYKESYIWFKKSSEQGEAKSQCMLGDLYYEGHGLKSKDGDKAFYWYSKAAEQQNDVAIYALGLCYANGTGTKRNIDEAKNQFNWVLTYSPKKWLIDSAKIKLKGLTRKGFD